MAFGVFIHRIDSIYDDSPAERYQFPRQYLGRVRACVGDWVLYYEPRRVVNTRGYYAVARVEEVIEDPSAAGMFIAVIKAGSYLEFVRPVAFSGPDGVVERGVLNEAGALSGRAQSAVRPISVSDFNRILDLGLDEPSVILPRVGEATTGFAFREDQTPYDYGHARDRVSYMSSRIVRDRVFRRAVLEAYDDRCAVTGLRLINGGGRAEAEAAHIWPVEHSGPDAVTNGIALSGTVHWMFDRGLISLADNLEILISRQVNNRDGVLSLVNQTGHATPPKLDVQRPHPRFLSWHRENCFKQ